MNFSLSDSPLRPQKKRGDGKVVMFLTVLVFGGALFMLTKTWYQNRPPENSATGLEQGLTALRFMSPETVLDHIKKNEQLLFLDIRSRNNFDAYHLLDAQWIAASEIATYVGPSEKIIVIVYDAENSNDQLRALHEQFSAQQLNFGFLEGGIENWIASGGGIIARGDQNSSVDKTKVTPITPRQVMELVPTLVRVMIVDVRSPEDYRAGHIPTAINVPLNRLEQDRQSIRSMGSLFVYGSSDTDTFQAGTRLFDMGFFGLRTITGGYTAWTEQDLPIETSLPPSQP